MELPGSRVLIQEEETKFRGPVSESLIQKLAGNSNMFTKQVDTLRWSVQGQQGDFQWPLVADGPRMLYRDYEVLGFSMWMYGVGVNAHPFEVSVFKYTASGMAGTSIFTVQPSWLGQVEIPLGPAFWMYDLSTATHIANDYGTFNTPTLDPDVPLTRGSWLGFGIEKAPNLAWGFDFQLFIRVR